MKKIFISLMLCAVSATVCAQDIVLPSPDFDMQSASMINTLLTRHSVRNFSSEKLSNQQLSNLCWAAFGMSRDAEHRTAPTAMNRKEIRLFVFNAEGVYEYEATTCKLIRKAEGDQRALIASRQEFAKDAPVSLLMVIDFDLFGKMDEKAVQMGCVDAGNVSENVNLYCQSVGLATVPRATMDVDGIRQLLGFTDHQLPIMNNPVGFEKK